MPRADPNFSGNEIQWISSQSTGKYKIIESMASKPEKISFWNDAPPFQSSTDADSIANPINKFVIEKIEVKSRSKILYGTRQVAIVSGIFSESEFEVGQKVDIFPCLCCLDNGDAVSCEDILFSASSDYTDDLNHNSAGCSIRQKASNDEGMDAYGNKVVFQINDKHNIIMVEDDILTVTAFCSAQECINNPLIKSMVADFSFEHSHPSLILGIIIHEIIQACLVSKQSSFAYVTKEAKKIINSKLLLLYSCNISEKEALNEVLKHLRNVIKFLSAGFSIDSVEHKVYSSCYGLKGSIDCLDVSTVIEIKTGKCLRVEHRSQTILYAILMMEQHLRKGKEDYNQFLCDISPTFTGNRVAHHPEIRKLSPLLYYVKSGDFLKIDLNHQEIIHLLKLRNDIACHKALSPCHCPDNYPCTILNRINGLHPEHFLKRQLEAIESEGKHEKTFFKGIKIEQRNERAVYKISEKMCINEYVYIHSTNYKIICFGVVESMENGRATIVLRESIDLDKVIMICLDNDTNFLKFMRWSLVQIAYGKYLRGDIKDRGIDSFLLPGQEHGLESAPLDGGRHNTMAEETYVSDAGSSSSNEFSISLDEISSIDLGTGFSSDEASGVNNKRITGLNANLDKTTDGFIAGSEACHHASPRSKFIEDLLYNSSIEADFSCAEINRGSSDSIPFCNSDSGDSSEQIVLSKIETQNESCIARSCSTHTRSLNEVGTFETKTSANDTLGSSSLPKPKIAFNHCEFADSSPYFAPSAKTNFQSYKYCIPEMFRDDFLRLNGDQRSALFLALNCESYRIIHGMPGTGKSTLISLLIRILIHYGLKVLLVCYTHMAIENILKKIGGVNYYRAKKENVDCRTYEELRQLMKKPDLVAGTCYSFGDPIYIERRFDYCIVDEGSQMHLLLALIPISLCDRFCIVGDHLQLKPLAKKSKELSLSLSLFEYLIEGCSMLTMQYRMGDSIMRLSNMLFYNNKLVGFGKASTVQFIDSSDLDYSFFIKSLGKCTILCYFNSQVRETTQHTENLVTTIDRFQGSESDELVVVFDPVERCEVVESRERLNVALTRARVTLKLVGNKKGMMEIPLFRQLLEIL